MRFGKLFFVATLFAAISLTVLMVGCSKDSATSPVADNGYSATQAEFGLFTDSLTAQMANGVSVFQNLDGNINIAYSPVNPDSTKSTGGWRVVYVSDLVAGFTMYLVDSIQFRANGVIQDVATGADQMQIIRRWGVENPDTTVTYRNVEVTSSFIYSNLQSSTILVSGGRQSTIHSKIVGTNGSVKRDFNINMVASNVAVPKGTTHCPQAGTLGGTIVQTVDRGSVPVTTTWQYDVTIDAGAISGQVTAGAWSATVTGTLCQ